MPNRNPRTQNLRTKGLRKHFDELGLDYALFVRMIETPDVKISRMRPFFRRPDGSMYSWHTVKEWGNIYLEEKSEGKNGMTK